MNRKEILVKVSIAIFCIVFVALIMWYNPDKALELLFVDIISVGGVLLLLRGVKIDQRKDERTMQLMTLGGRNAFMFLILVMPAVASLSIAGVISIDAFAALMVLWIVAMGIAWISFLYYYTR